MRLKLNTPSRLRWSLLAGAAMLAPALPSVATAQGGVLVIDSRGASVQRERAPALLSDADGFAAGYDNGAVVVDLSVLDGGQSSNQPLRLRPPPTRRALAAAPEYVPQTNQFATAPPQLYPPRTASQQLGMRLPPRRPASLTERVQLAVAAPRPAYQPPPQMPPPAVVSRPRSFSQSSVVRAPAPRIVASAPPPKARVQSRHIAEIAPPIRRRKPTPPPPAAPAPLPLSIALAPTLPERQPLPRPSPAAPPPKQAPLLRLAPGRPGLPPAASIRTPAAPPVPRPALNLTKSLPAPPPMASVPAAPRPLPPPPAPIKFAPIRNTPAPPPAYKPVQPKGQAAAVLALPPVLPIRNAPTAPPPPALTERPNMVAPQLPSAEQPIRHLPAFSSAPPPVLPPAPQPRASTPVPPPPISQPMPLSAPPSANDGLVTPLPLPRSTAALPPLPAPPGFGPLEQFDRHQLASLPPKEPRRPATPRSQVRQIAALPVSEPLGARPLMAPAAPARVISQPMALPTADFEPARAEALSLPPPPPLPPAPLQQAPVLQQAAFPPSPPPTSPVALPPPPLSFESEAVTRPMGRDDNPELASLPPALRLEQSRPVPAMAQPKSPAPSARESLSLPAPPPRSTTPPMQMASAEELLGGDATSGIEASDALKARFPIIFDRQNPPAMAQPGWTPAAPAATIAAARPRNLAPLVSLAPPRQPEEPRRLLAALPPAAPAARTVQLPTLTSQPLPNLVQPPVAEPRPFNGVTKPSQVQRQFTPNLEQSRSIQPRADRSRIVRPRMAPPRLPVQQPPRLASPAPLPPAPAIRQAPKLAPSSTPALAAVQQSEPQSFNGIRAPDSLPPASLIQAPQRRTFVPGAALPQPIASRAAEPDFGNVTQPGSAVLAPPPPPARAPEIAARPESQSALPVPATEVSNQAPRRGLAIPDGLARVTAPQQVGGDAPSRLLTPPPIDDLSKAPGFAPLPLPAPIAPPVAEAPSVIEGPSVIDGLAQDFNAVPPPRLSELAPPSRRTAFVPPASGSQDFSTDIAFAGGSRSLPGDAMPALSAIADRMKSNPGLQARVSGAAAVGDPGEARDVALARALAVQRYLLSRGVMSDAIKVQPVTGGQGRDGVSVTLVVPA